MNCFSEYIFEKTQFDLFQLTELMDYDYSYPMWQSLPLYLGVMLSDCQVNKHGDNNGS